MKKTTALAVSLIAAMVGCVSPYNNGINRISSFNNDEINKINGIVAITKNAASSEGDAWRWLWTPTYPPYGYGGYGSTGTGAVGGYTH